MCMDLHARHPLHIRATGHVGILGLWYPGVLVSVDRERPVISRCGFVDNMV